MSSLGNRLRAAGFFVAAVVAAALLAWFLLRPETLSGGHRLTLVALLLVTAIIGFWQTWVLSHE